MKGKFVGFFFFFFGGGGYIFIMLPRIAVHLVMTIQCKIITCPVLQ